MDSFAKEIIEGLSAKPRYLPTKYFYNKEGDRLFKEITKLDEYYLTRAEEEILERHSFKFLEYFSNGGDRFNLIELGPGDGMKTHLILKDFLNNGTNFEYFPVDISDNVLDLLEANLGEKLPELKIKSLNLDYFEALKELHRISNHRNVVFFLGSNIGNFRREQAVEFLKALNSHLIDGDLLLIGMDLKKDPNIIRRAYDDSKGVTRAFNMNYLQRINEELDADFDLQCFEHSPEYDEESGAAESFISVLRANEVRIGKHNKSFSFDAGEKIFMEISQKFDEEKIEDLAAKTGFEVVKYFYDSRNYFTDVIWRKTKNLK